jgi:hypothetical protein
VEGEAIGLGHPFQPGVWAVQWPAPDHIATVQNLGGGYTVGEQALGRLQQLNQPNAENIAVLVAELPCGYFPYRDEAGSNQCLRMG